MKTIYEIPHINNNLIETEDVEDITVEDNIIRLTNALANERIISNNLKIERDTLKKDLIDEKRIIIYRMKEIEELQLTLKIYSNDLNKERELIKKLGTELRSARIMIAYREQTDTFDI